MTSLLATRRRAEEFARHIEERQASHDPTMAPLLELVGRLQPSPAAEPSPVFRSALREHLVTVAADLPAAARVEPIPQRTGIRVAPTRVRITGFAAAFAVAGALVAVAAFARGSLPGDALYPVKTKLEGAQVAVATNPESRGRQYLAQSERRLDEMTRLVEKTPVSQQDPEQLKLISSTLRDFTKDSRRAGKLLTEAYQAKDRAAAVRQLRQFSADSSSRLAAIGPSLPPVLGPEYDEALNTLDDLDQLVMRLCPTCLTDGLLGQSTPPEQSDSASTDGTTAATPTSASDQTTQRGQTTPGKTPGPLPSQTVGESPLPTSTLRVPGVPLPTLVPTLVPTLGWPGLPLNLPTILPLPQVVEPLDSLLPLLVPQSIVADESSPAPSETPATPLPSTPGTPQPTTPSPTTTTTEDGGILDGVIDGGLLGDLQLPLL